MSASTDCKHHWVLEAPDNDGVSAGRCRKCKTKKNFDGGNQFTTKREHRENQLGWGSLPINPYKPNPRLMSDDIEEAS